jgi:hypothetical protein
MHTEVQKKKLGYIADTILIFTQSNTLKYMLTCIKGPKIKPVENIYPDIS